MTTDLIRSLPKVLLHEHLDGGLRPETVIELAREAGYPDLPTDDPAELAAWFHRGANRGNLPEYLAGFTHTCAVMQTAEALERSAFEFIEDMADDGVVYAEVRFAPVLHTDGGLAQEAVVQAVLRGMRRGQEAFGVDWGVIICSLRNRTDSLEAAELALNFRDQGVVGFDLAGEEAGYPPKKHIEAFNLLKRENFFITVHAGEAFGCESIWQALQYCGAHRLGHATRLLDDVTVVDGRIAGLGRLAQYVLDRRIPLELCLLSNLHTGAIANIGDHPFRLFYDHGFRVTLNTDDRLMSNTSMTREFETARDHFNVDVTDMEKLTINAMKSAFAPFHKRIDIIYEKIKPAYAALSQ